METTYFTTVTITIGTGGISGSGYAHLLQTPDINTTTLLHVCMPSVKKKKIYIYIYIYIYIL